MTLKKSIVLVALAAATVAPSALAQYPPIDAGDPGPSVLTQGSGINPKPKLPRVCGQRGILRILSPSCFAPGV